MISRTNNYDYFKPFKRKPAVMPHIQTAQYLIQLEQQLKQSDLWSGSIPSDTALASTAPFACDSLRFEQWLQFIFIPKMGQLIEQCLPLPTQISLTPMAEQAWVNHGDLTALVELLTQIDNFLTRQ
ncbi:MULTISPECIES: YqcC family protein [unclassified Shewanella]|uniref:YqcC family protein n=1 Tax=unclassified Shewanella TaxID=196818 RepID=UPI0026D6FD19|nr:YqcC family protein [Shewanella sp. 10N.7]